MNSIARASMPNRRIAICCAGGGATGMVSVGYFKRIYERKIQPSMLFGTSAGALSVAAFAMGDLDLMEWLWLNISKRDVMRLAPWKLFTPAASVYDSSPLEATLRKHIDISRIRANAIPTYITTSDIYSMQAKHWRIDIEDATTPDPIKLLLASTAVPALFPPVGVWYDGGITDNYNAQMAADLGADQIFMLHTHMPRHKPIKTIRDVPEIVLANLGWSNYTAEIEAIKNHPNKPELVALAPTFPVPVGMWDFDAPIETRKMLIKQAYDLAVQVLG